MRFVNIKIITILITVVFTTVLIMGFGGYVFAGDPVPGLDITIEQIPGGKVSTKNYNSSLSNKSIAQVRMEVGDILLRYGVGGADINKVTGALEGSGVYEAELKSFLIAIGINVEGVEDVMINFDRLGVGFDSPKVESTAGETASPSGAGDIIQGIDKEEISRDSGEISTTNTEDASTSAVESTVRLNSIERRDITIKEAVSTPDEEESAQARGHRQ